MPKTLEKTRKQIAKKRNGTIDALHQYSRDSKRLHKAQVRDERLEKLIAARKKHDQPLSTRQPSVVFSLIRSANADFDISQSEESGSSRRQLETTKNVPLKRIRSRVSLASTSCLSRLSAAPLADCIRFVHQHDEEMEAMKKTRRAGRPASASHDMLKLKIDGLVKEQQNGFCKFGVTFDRRGLLTNWNTDIPDLTKQDNIDLLDRWEGAWSFLASMSYIRISKDGTVKPSSFPPSSQ